MSVTFGWRRKSVCSITVTKSCRRVGVRTVLPVKLSVPESTGFCLRERRRRVCRAKSKLSRKQARPFHRTDRSPTTEAAAEIKLHRVCGPAMYTCWRLSGGRFYRTKTTPTVMLVGTRFDGTGEPVGNEPAPQPYRTMLYHMVYQTKTDCTVCTPCSVSVFVDESQKKKRRRKRRHHREEKLHNTYQVYRTTVRYRSV